MQENEHNEAKINKKNSPTKCVITGDENQQINIPIKWSMES